MGSQVQCNVEAPCLSVTRREGPSSGKTAVYAEAIATALAHGRGALVLVPEIALATPLIDRLRHDLSEDVVMLHSAMSEGERADEWRRIRGQPDGNRVCAEELSEVARAGSWRGPTMSWLVV